ncbi:hypothetical protein [Stenotrophomonas tuberculopleuritidis]|nr:hypothetical protein [Stenotrophomonas sp. 704A1]
MNNEDPADNRVFFVHRHLRSRCGVAVLPAFMAGQDDNEKS